MFTPASGCDCIGPDFYIKQFLGTAQAHPVFGCLYFGRLPECAVITPSYENQLVGPSALNRFIEKVSVSRVPIVTSTITLAVAAEATYTFVGAAQVVSSDTATATATIVDGAVIVTGVAAGTTTVTISDISGNTIATVSVTVA